MAKPTPQHTADVALLSLRDGAQVSHNTEFCDALHTSLVKHGFVRISDHGINTHQLAQAYEMVVDLFNLPDNVKQKYLVGRGGERGYTSLGLERAAGSDFADLKEFWHIGPELPATHPYNSVYPRNIWPSELPALKEFFLPFYAQLQSVADQLLLALGAALGLQDDYFKVLTKDGNSVLRLIHYPALATMDATNRMRAAPHADINLLTLLVGASDTGLQLLDKNNRWCDVPSNEGEIIVDSGDMMALITGGTIPATIHRVVNPTSGTKPRYSMPFFVHPHSEALLECLPQFKDRQSPSPSITAGEFLAQRLAENGF